MRKLKYIRWQKTTREELWVFKYWETLRNIKDYLNKQWDNRYYISKSLNILIK